MAEFFHNLFTIGIAGNFLLAAGLLLMLAHFICMAVWIYQDAVHRKIRPFLWVVVVFIANPIISLIIYLLIGRAEEKIYCPQCGSKIQREAAYCERCGFRRNMRDDLTQPKEGKVSPLFLICSAISFVLSILCFILLSILFIMKYIKI